MLDNEQGKCSGHSIFGNEVELPLVWPTVGFLVLTTSVNLLECPKTLTSSASTSMLPLRSLVNVVLPPFVDGDNGMVVSE